MAVAATPLRCRASVCDFVRRVAELRAIQTSSLDERDGGETQPWTSKTSRLRKRVRAIVHAATPQPVRLGHSVGDVP